MGDEYTFLMDDPPLDRVNLSCNHFKKIALSTLRSNGFDFGYNDGRDQEHAFTFTLGYDGEPIVKEAHLTELNIDHVL